MITHMHMTSDMHLYGKVFYRIDNLGVIYPIACKILFYNVQHTNKFFAEHISYQQGYI